MFTADHSAPDGAAIVAEARTWVGTRFRHHGRIKGHACDCAGLILGVAKALGVPMIDRPIYAPDPDPLLLVENCAQQLKSVQTGQQRAGDIVLFAFKGQPKHLGILTDYHGGGFGVIHAYIAARAVVEHRLDDEWAVVGYYRFKGQ